MKLTFFLLLSFLIAACQPSFHRQKHTNFGHGRTLKLKEAQTEVPEKTFHFDDEILIAEAEVPETTDPVAEIPVLTEGQNEVVYEDPLPNNHCAPADTVRIQQPTAPDTTQAILYSRQLKREATRNLLIGAGEIAIGVLAFLFLPYWLPILIVHAVVALIFLIVAAHKAAKAKTVSENPGRYKVKETKTSTDRSIYVLSLVGYGLLLLAAALALLLIFFVATAVVITIESLLYFILVVIVLYFLSIPLGLTAAVLLLIAAFKGRNQTRKENLSGEPANRRIKIFNAINWTVIAAAFTAFVVSISERFKP